MVFKFRHLRLERFGLLPLGVDVLGIAQAFADLPRPSALLLAGCYLLCKLRKAYPSAHDGVDDVQTFVWRDCEPQPGAGVIVTGINARDDRPIRGNVESWLAVDLIIELGINATLCRHPSAAYPSSL